MVQGLLGMLFGILEWLISLFPSFQFINKFVLSLNSISSVLYEASPFVPFNDLFICIGLISSFYIGLFLIKGINWIIHRVPFLN
ncbi:hypothetical protein [Streptococcus marmotae]